MSAAKKSGRWCTHRRCSNRPFRLDQGQCRNKFANVESKPPSIEQTAILQLRAELVRVQTSRTFRMSGDVFRERSGEVRLHSKSYRCKSTMRLAVVARAMLAHVGGDHGYRVRMRLE